MAKSYGLTDNFKTEGIWNQRKNRLALSIVDQVDLRINNVDTNEIDRLCTEVYSLRSGRYRDNVILDGNGRQDFVITVKPARLEEIKEALSVILKVVKGERIAIET